MFAEGIGDLSSIRTYRFRDAKFSNTYAIGCPQITANGRKLLIWRKKI